MMKNNKITATCPKCLGHKRVYDIGFMIKVCDECNGEGVVYRYSNDENIENKEDDKVKIYDTTEKIYKSEPQPEKKRRGRPKKY